MINFGRNFTDLMQKKAQIDLDVPPPAGEYVLAITDAKMPIPDMGKPEYLLVTFTVEEGEHEGRRINQRFYWHDEKGFGFRRLALLFEAAGVPFGAQIEEKQLVGKKVTGRVKVSVNKATGKEFTEVASMKEFDPSAAKPSAEKEPWEA